MKNFADKIFQLFFTLGGRIGRLSFFLVLILVWIILILLYILVFGFDFSNFWQNYSGNVVVVNIIGMILAFSPTIKRLHDINYSGWYIILLYFPIIGTVFSLMLLFKKGIRGQNKYGINPNEIKKPEEIITKKMN